MNQEKNPPAPFRYQIILEKPGPAVWIRSGCSVQTPGILVSQSGHVPSAVIRYFSIKYPRRSIKLDWQL